MSSTLRERNRRIIPLGIWALATVLCTIAGPFGTHAVFEVLPRFLYWAGVTAVSVLGSVLCMRLSERRSPWSKLAVWGGFTLLLAGALHLLNSLLFSNWVGLDQFVHLLGNIAVTVGVVHGAIALAQHVFSTGEDEKDADPQIVFMRRLPIEKRAPLIRLEAQDHYLNVVTQAGSALILMRLQDAVDALAGTQGLQVHRSHWVAQTAVAAHRRDRGRDFLVLSNGDEIPVSRSFRTRVQEAGLI